MKAPLHKYYCGWIVLTPTCHFSGFFFSFSSWHLFHSGIFTWAIKQGDGRADERQSGGWTLLFHPMNHHWEKEVKDWRHDENLINRNIWSSINEYWIFNLGQKSTVDRREHYGPSQGPVSLRGLAGIDQLSFTYALNFARHQNKSATQHWHWRVKRSQKSVDVTTAPACLVNITLIFTVFSAYVGPPVPSGFDAQAP